MPGKTLLLQIKITMLSLLKKLQAMQPPMPMRMQEKLRNVSRINRISNR